MKEKLQRFISGQLSLAVIFIILGLCLIIMPVNTLDVLCKVIFGIALIVSGGHHIYLHLSEKKDSTIFNRFSGVITMVIGFFLFFNMPIVVKLLPWMLGCFVLVDCVWLVKAAINMKKRPDPIWQGMLVLSIVFVVLSVILLVNPFSTVRKMLGFAGWIILAKGISNIIARRLLDQVAKKPIPAAPVYRPETDSESGGYVGRVQPQITVSNEVQDRSVPADDSVQDTDANTDQAVDEGPDMADLPDVDDAPAGDELQGDDGYQTEDVYQDDVDQAVDSYQDDSEYQNDDYQVDDGIQPDDDYQVDESLDSGAEEHFGDVSDVSFTQEPIELTLESDQPAGETQE